MPEFYFFSAISPSLGKSLYHQIRQPTRYFYVERPIVFSV
jgi:hypothetical protein